MQADNPIVGPYVQFLSFLNGIAGEVVNFLPKSHQPRETQVDRVTMVLAFTVMHAAVFYGFSLFFALCDHFGWLQRYRIQPKAYAPSELIRKALFHTLLNHFVVNPLLFYFAWPKLVANGIFLSNPKLIPSVSTMLKQILVCIALEDTTFYWLHRLLHTKYFYAAVHKQHHQFKQNVGVAAEYASTLEEVLGTGFPFLIGPILFKTHLATFMVWTFLRISETVNAHSGYYIPWIPYNMFPKLLGGADRHDYHHSKNVGSFGSWTRFWDWICGTDASYWRWKEAQSGKAN